MKSEKKFYYAVKVGRKPGIYTSWSDCSAQTSGYSCAEYKRFDSRTEALIYLGASALVSTLIAYIGGAANEEIHTRPRHLR
jgi:viroplasmin and RNaseH domain-containing protein